MVGIPFSSYNNQRNTTILHKNEIDIITLGCSKDLVDADRLMRQLEAAGYRCVHDSEQPQGEIAVINTCGFIGDAKEESINTILQFAERKKRKKLKKLFVMGCLSERYMAELEEELPEVDKYYGKFSFMDLIADLGHAVETGCLQERTLTTPGHFAYLKISEGCNRFCSYCAIPLITGRHTSRPMEEILEEVRWLTKQGVKEFQVIAQDLSAYGTELEVDGRKGMHLLPQLIERMSDIEGVDSFALRLPYRFSDGPLARHARKKECVQVPRYRASALYGQYAHENEAAHFCSRTNRLDSHHPTRSTGDLPPNDSDGGASG